MSFESVAAFKSVLQRKALVGALLVADYDADAIAKLTGTGGDLVIDPDYGTLGKVSSDGIEIEGETEKQEDRHWGDAYPSRIDIQSESSAMNFTAVESRKTVFDNFYGVDQTTVVADEDGEITFDKPPLPVLRDKRVLALFRDINKSNGLYIYMAVLYPKANISPNGAQTFANAEGGLNYPMTAQALMDETEGTAQRLFWGGPGLMGLLVDMGYALPTP